MEVNENAQVDPSQIDDQRGRGGGGLGGGLAGIPIPTTKGGLIVTAIVVLLMLAGGGCPEANKVYIDLTFYNQLSDQFGAKGAFAQPYVLAHEYGHHIQDLLGVESDVQRAEQRDPSNQNKYSVMLELQADCYAGVWANHATSTKDTHGQPIFTSVSQTDIKDALDAAAAVGDAAVQKKMGGGVDESKFTHGSSAQRDQWFQTGYSSGDPKSCDTFGNALS